MKTDVLLSQNPYSAPYTSLGAEVLDNFYLEFAQSDTARAKYYQVGRQGLHKLFPGENGVGCRALMTTSSNRTFAVNGNTLWEYVSGGQSRLNRGSIDAAAGTDPVYIRENGYQLFLVTGGYGYIFDLTSNMFSRITDEFFPGATDPTQGPSHAVMVDTYFSANSQNTNTYFWSAPYYKPYSFDPLQPTVQNLWWGTYYGQKIGDTDNIVAMIEVNTNIIAVFGQNSLEFHRDTGNTTGQLFQRVDVASTNFGCLAKHSVVRFNNQIYWLGRSRSGTVGVFAVGPDFNPQRVSKRGVETRIQTYDQVSDCVAFPFSIDGHDFISWNFPSGTSVDGGAVTGATWIFDITTGQWYRYTRWDVPSGASYRWSAQFATYNWGMLLMGDVGSDALYWMDNEHFVDDHPMDDGFDYHNRILTSPNSYVDGKLIRYMSEQLNLQQGTALRNGQGSAPIFWLSDSDDGGFTFGYEVRGEMGQTGQYAHRTKWNRRGRCRNRVRKYRCTEPIRVIVIGETLEMDVGNQ